MRTKNESETARSTTMGGHARRAAIERAAAEVLAESGYAAASVGRIAQRAGVSKGVITYHFPQKDDILRRVALALFEDCAAHVAAQVSPDMSAEVHLRALLRAELGFFSSRRVAFRAMTEVMANHRDADFLQVFESVSAHETRSLAGLLRQGQDEGLFRACDVDQTAALIEAAKNGTLERWASDDSLDLSVMTATLLDFVEHAVRADHRPE